MYVFLDESGDTGYKFDKGSSKFFTLTAVVFETNAASIEATNKIKAIISKMKDPKFEFHFTKNTPGTRKKFLSCLEGCQFYWYSISIDKQLIFSPRLQNSDHMLKTVAKYLCNNLKDKVENGIFIFDKNDSKKFYKELSTILKTEFNGENSKVVKEIKALESHREVLIQIADYCAGIINLSKSENKKKFNYGKELYQYLATKNISNQTWPKSK